MGVRTSEQVRRGVLAKTSGKTLTQFPSGEGEENSVLGNVLIFYQERIYMYNLYHYFFFLIKSIAVVFHSIKEKTLGKKDELLHKKAACLSP